MTDWLQFSLSDMTPYDRQGWFWLIENYQQDYPYLPLVSLLFSMLCAYLIFRPVSSASRVTLGLLALSWLWCGWVFQMQYHASLNWAAPQMGWVFVVQAALLGAVALFGKTLVWRHANPRSHWPALLVLLLALCYPLLGWFEGRTAQQLEWPGLMTAPTTFFTVGILMLLGTRYWLLLMPVPVLWALVSAAFTWKLALFEPYVAALVLLLLVVMAIRVLFRGRQQAADQRQEGV